MDREKLKLDDFRRAAVRSRISTIVRHHQPLLAFLLFAGFVLLCVHLPWGGSSDGSMPHMSMDEAVAKYNKTVPPGNGTVKYLPAPNPVRKPRFAKVAIASGFEDILYERALDTHVKHAEKHGYPLYMARETAAEGMFNKVAFIMDVLLNELFKPADERVEWLFYFDVDSIIMNQEIPLEIFEPPSDFSHIHWMAGRDWNGLNAGVFMLRVTSWSLDLLTRTMTYKHYHPNEDYTFEEQSILARLTETDKDFIKHSIYVPRKWFNAYYYNLHEVQPGLLLSHFPHPDYKWHIYEWMRVLESDVMPGVKPMYNRPLSETPYPEEIKRFWNVKRRADKVLIGFERNVNRGADPIQFGMQHEETKALAEEFRDKYAELKKAATTSGRTDEPDALEKLVNETEEKNAALIQTLMAYFETHDNPPPVAGF
ncbi:hypothetical protein EJ06DRAFT_524478 [Trichodelitschia bisporula]|uniref:Galactosyl transferase GMA12/MNN10 family protein n=1 Tax=Trichodelitschia bisporula TaxID=703511 RepID=A0A6G1HKA5_9PEZI|nr:hypothetical protein EJ06DRAFT_524478 [Trichodelitschia bisporula]